jgi:uncharacterized repeat protein (TIGR01451 family)
MNTTKQLLISSITGIAAAGLIVAPALACTPKGKITKYVTNVTTGSQMVDANTVADALVVHPGDTLTYTIVVGNDGGTTKDDADAMIETIMTDTLPAGVTAVSGTSNINENIGRISEHSKVTKTYNVTVNKDVKDGDVINNKACYTGKATDHNSKVDQAGCDVAIVKVSVPPVQPPVQPPKTPELPKETPKVEAASVELPVTGVGNLFVPAGVAAGVGYVGNLLRLKRRK